jgi:hypothetical protein
MEVMPSSKRSELMSTKEKGRPATSALAMGNTMLAFFTLLDTVQGLIEVFGGIVEVRITVI